jgi:hypothetical protein
MLFITKNNLLNDAQHGFFEGKSTERATLAFLESIQKAMEKRTNLIGIFFNLSKVYNVLDHKILLFKLDAYGIRGIVNQWFKSYLCSRKQYVEIDYMENTSRISKKFTSILKETKGAVPLGSVLSPVLFRLYI